MRGAVAPTAALAAAVVALATPVRAQEAGAAAGTLEALDLAGRRLMERAGPAVVRVDAERTVPIRLREPAADEMARIAMEGARTARETVTATGFVIDGGGDGDRGDLVVTVHAAVDRRSDAIRVTFPGGQVRDAACVGADPVSGIALLRIRPVEGVRPLVPATAAPHAGSLAFLLGFADDDSPSIEMGFVTATRRAVGLYDAYVVAGVPFRAGDAGAPLVDARGAVLGIAVAPSPDRAVAPRPLRFADPASAVALAADGGGGSGPPPTRCVPAAELRRVVDALRDHGRVPHGLCGVRVHESEPVITEVPEGLPAAAAGVQAGDRVLAVDATPVTTPRQFVGFILRRAPGTPVLLRLRSPDGTEREVTVVLAEREEPAAPPPAWFNGLGVADRDGGGVEVRSVFPGSPASVAGIRVGDVVVSIAGREIAREADYEAAATADLSDRRAVEVVVLRAGRRLTLVLR